MVRFEDNVNSIFRQMLAELQLYVSPALKTTGMRQIEEILIQISEQIVIVIISFD